MGSGFCALTSRDICGNAVIGLEIMFILRPSSQMKHVTTYYSF